jgi:hypothetical protein
VKKSRRHTGRRALVVAASVPLALGFIGVGTAFADPGNGQGHANAYGQLKKQPTASTTASPTVNSTAQPGSSDHSQGNASTTGDASSPQPYSNADQNNTGANDTSASNPYKSTRDGSPSQNGNGNGKATGKPCAGCVGKADNKNPKGQAPNGSDHNAGYECDRNHGIGRSNPAHTGCKSTLPPPPPTCEQTNTCPPKPDCKTTNTCPKPPCEQTGTCEQPPPGDCTTTNTCPPCDDTQENCTTPPVPPTVPPTHVKAVHHSRVPVAVVPAQASQLPFTGLNVAELLLLGVFSLSAGAVLWVAGRKRRTAQTVR